MKRDFSILKFREEINKRLKISFDALLKNDKAKAQENIEWIETASKLIEKTKQKPSKVKWAMIVGLVSVFLIGLGLTLRIPKTNISVDIETKSVSFKLKKEWILDNRFSLSEVNITNLKEVYAAGANISVTKEQPFDLTLKGNNILIDKLVFSPNANITIGVQNNGVNFIIKNDTLVTDVQVSEAHLNIDGGQVDTTLKFEIPEIFNITSFPSVAIPIDIMLVDTANWNFRDLLISDINFLEESVPGSGKFISSITSGNIKILETDKDTKLEEGDWLLLKNLKNRRIQIAKSMSGLKIHFEGEVSKASAGSELFEKKLNPTVIEYLYYAKSFAFFWSSIVFICSLIWSLKNTIFSSE